MNLDIEKWKPFKLGKIFNVKYGVNLELNACVESTEEGCVNFVSRTESNNGVSSKILPLEDVVPQPAGLISLAGGGSALSTFYQNKEFYSGRDLYTLETVVPVSVESKMFLITVITKNKFRYSYGRQVNKTLPYIELLLPACRNNEGDFVIDRSRFFSDDGYIPDWQFMEDYIKSLHYKPIKTGNSSCNELNTNKWDFFYLKDICRVSMGNKLDYSAMTTEIGQVNFVGRSDNNNGVADKVDLIDGISPYDAGCLSVALGGSLGACFYQDEPFYTSQNVAVLEFESNVSKYAKIFIACLVKNESRYKYFPFGRELNTHIRTDFGFTLPVLHNGNEPIIDKTCKYHPKGYIPDWQYMEDYIKSLPYGDRI